MHTNYGSDGEGAGNEMDSGVENHDHYASLGVN